MFDRANLQECSVVADIINKYERASGQKSILAKLKELLATKYIWR